MVAGKEDGPEDNFDKRLEQARSKLGKDETTDTEEAQREELSAGYRMGIEFVSAVAIGALLGYWLDRWFGTSPFLLIGLMLLGTVAGIRNLMRLL